MCSTAFRSPATVFRDVRKLYHRLPRLPKGLTAVAPQPCAPLGRWLRPMPIALPELSGVLSVPGAGNAYMLAQCWNQLTVRLRLRARACRERGIARGTVAHVRIEGRGGAQ